jgi:hypothetical protein
MTATMAAPMNNHRVAGSDEFDFGDHLPAGMTSFTPNFLANFVGGTPQHWINLAEKGAFGKGLADLRAPGASKMMLRIPRKPLVEFLNSRRDLQAVADANPPPKPRPYTGGKSRRRKK